MTVAVTLALALLAPSAVPPPLALAAAVAAALGPELPGTPRDKLGRAAARYRRLLAAHRLSDPPPALRIEVEKEARRLTLFSGSTRIFTARVGLGGAPVGPKLEEGDLKTPEGTYYVCTRNERSRFHLFLGLSYPDLADAARGRRDGLIGAAEERRIREAVRRRAPVPWNTRLGGAIGIHGNGGSSDWTLGCVALEDGEIEALWQFGRLGTPVVIKP